MTPPKKCIATKSGALLALLLASQLAVAEPAGVVSDSTGPLLAKSASGSIKVLVVGSSVEPLDTLISRPGVYARVTLTDHSDLALGPDTELAIESYSFQDKGSQADTAVLRLSKGSVRISSGTLGTRDTDTFTLAAGPATINIHHSVFIATYIDGAEGQLAQRDVDSTPRMDRTPPSIAGSTLPIQGTLSMEGWLLPATARSMSGHMYVRVASITTRPAQPLELTDSPLRLSQIVPPRPTPNTGTMAPGLYVQVLDGMINLSNAGGSQNFAAGQFGYTPSITQPPIVVPTNPGMQFTPPPAFSASATNGTQNNGSKSGTVDCVVR
jgi:FecR protein